MIRIRLRINDKSSIYWLQIWLLPIPSAFYPILVYAARLARDVKFDFGFLNFT